MMVLIITVSNYNIEKNTNDDVENNKTNRPIINNINVIKDKEASRARIRFTKKAIEWQKF